MPDDVKVARDIDPRVRMLSFFPEPLNPSDPVDMQLVNDYRAVFMETPAGRHVLQHMLSNLMHFKPARYESDMILQNYAKTLLRNCGLWEYPNMENIVEKYAEVPRYM